MIKNKEVKKFYHVGKNKLDGPGGPKPEGCSMEDNM